MNGFTECQKVEAEALEIILPHAEKNNVQIVMTQGQHFLQKLYGDFIIRYKRENCKFVELKAERENRHGNLFLESWSNLSWLNPGWMRTCKADVLWYFFIKERTIYSMNFNSLKEWMFEKGNVKNYREKLQKSTEQKNDTWGWCVPIADLEKANLLNWQESKIA